MYGHSRWVPGQTLLVNSSPAVSLSLWRRRAFIRSRVPRKRFLLYEAVSFTGSEHCSKVVIISNAPGRKPEEESAQDTECWGELQKRGPPHHARPVGSHFLWHNITCSPVKWLPKGIQKLTWLKVTMELKCKRQSAACSPGERNVPEGQAGAHLWPRQTGSWTKGRGQSNSHLGYLKRKGKHSYKFTAEVPLSHMITEHAYW